MRGSSGADSSLGNRRGGGWGDVSDIRSQIQFQKHLPSCSPLPQKGEEGRSLCLPALGEAHLMTRLTPVPLTFLHMEPLHIALASHLGHLLGGSLAVPRLWFSLDCLCPTYLWGIEDPAKPGHCLLPPCTPSVREKAWHDLSCSWQPGDGDGRVNLSVYGVSLPVASLWAPGSCVLNQQMGEGLGSRIPSVWFWLSSAIQRTYFIQPR